MQTEADIISRIRNRDQDGIRILYTQYAESVMGIISRVIKDTQLAEEVLQQTLLKVWNKIEQYDDTKSGLFTWLSIIARNTAIDKVRTAGFRNTQTNVAINDNLDHAVDSENSTAAMDVRSLLKKLDSKHRILLQKMYLEGYTQTAIADEMNIPLGTVKSRLRTAILALRNELKNEKSLFLGSVIILAYLILKLIS